MTSHTHTHARAHRDTHAHIIRLFCPRHILYVTSVCSKTAVLPKAGFPVHTQERRLQFYQECSWGSFPLRSATPYLFFSIWTDLKRSENIPEHQQGGEESVRLTELSAFHQNSPQGLNISIRDFDQITGPEIPITLLPPKYNITVKMFLVICLHFRLP